MWKFIIVKLHLQLKITLISNTTFTIVKLNLQCISYVYLLVLLHLQL